MKEVKEFFENASPQTTAEQSISVPRTLRRVLLLGLLLSGPVSYTHLTLPTNREV